MNDSNEDATLFIHRVMNINAALPAMGGAEAGIIGATHPASSIVTQLRHAAMQLADAYRKNPGSDEVLRLAQEVEGSLSVLRSMSVVSEAVYAELIDILRRIVPR